MKTGWQAGCVDYAENMHAPTHEHTLYCEVIARELDKELAERRQANQNAVASAEESKE